jgi:hypothetical protein
MGVSKRKCPYCDEYNKPEEGLLIKNRLYCNIECAVSYGKKNAPKAKAKKEKSDRAQLRRRKEELRPRSWYLTEAQKWFNKFIRLRDANDLCISCDRSIEEIEGNDSWKVGGAWDCGHYLTRGARPELRFEELNAHKQCKSCNGGSGKYTKKNDTVGKLYRIKLIEKIGLEKVEWLEGLHEPTKYTIDDLKEIISKYKEKCKEIE